MGHIRKEELHESLINELEELGNIDLSGKQDKTDESLLTESKDLVGAINELFQSANNGKELIANAIGEPLDSNDTFSAMSNDINGLLSTFKTNMMNNGITVESGDKFKSLIDKIATMVEEGSGKGIQFATGDVKTRYATTNDGIFTGYNNNTSSIIELKLSFDPSFVIFATSGFIGAYYRNGLLNINNATDLVFHESTGNSDRYSIQNVMTPGDGILRLPTGVLSANQVLKWMAIGVGEEDTTLRDSLASILQEEGVSVTEEDDMASLITKVDEEFTKDNTAISDLEEDIENTRSTLAGLMQEGGYDITGDESIDSLLDLLVISGISVSDIKQIICGHAYTFILKNDGSLWACGYNNYRQLGIGSTSDINIFTQVTTNISDIKQIACGQNHTIILKNDGSLWACGLNNYGQLGLDNITEKSTFTQVTTNINNDVKQVACGQYHTIILKNDGSVWSCGENDGGRLGLGDHTDKKTFTQVTTNINNDVKQIYCGGNYTYILKNDGSVWSCGRNDNGQLGLGTSSIYKTTFTQVTTNINNDVKQIACGCEYTFILKNDGSVWSCGLNDYGQLGIGNTTDKSKFTQVTTNINNDVKQVDCGYQHTFILKNDGSVWSCGKNEYGALGLGTSDTNAHSTFTQVTTNINNDVKQIACGGYHTFILKNDGSAWSCGYNNSGQLGLGSTTIRTTFTIIPKGFSY